MGIEGSSSLELDQYGCESEEASNEFPIRFLCQFTDAAFF